MDVVNNPAVLGTLQFLTGSLAGRSFNITRPITNLGREPGNDIVISDPSVSRHHAQIMWNGSVWSIKKTAAQNSITLNQREVNQSPLNDRDTIGLGQGTTFLFLVAESARPTPPVTERGSASNQAPPMVPPAYANSVNNPPFQAPDPQRPPAPSNQPPVRQPQANFGPAAFNQANAYAPPPAYGADDPIATATQRSSLDGTSISRAPSQGIPTLEVSTNTDQERHSYPLTPDRQVFDIGRDPSNTIVINRPTVSSFHAQIVREGNQLVLIHPNPKRGHTLNGLTFQGQTIGGQQPFRRVLTRGDVFRISDANGTFVSLTFNDGSGQVQDVVPELQPIQLGAPVITFGRAPDNMVVLKHPQVSSHHARLEQVPGGGYRIIDQGSTNHVYVNTQRISNQVLNQGDIIRIGPFKLTYTGTILTQQDESYGIRIDALNLKKEGNKHVVLLNDISFAIPPRKFVALVGGSGAGKSTLMDALNGLRPAQQGVVLYNGQDYYRNLASFSTQLGYVPQDDIIHRDLTVERALYYAARLRLPQDFTEQQIQERINDVLEDVEMKHRRGLLVSKLSGGQRKRVSIALELLANPSVFFLDEPTSGLDPGLDRKMMLLLRKLADKGHTIVLVTHATNNINACDYICFLCQGGKLAYFGPPNDAKAYFGKTDFAEIYSALEPTDENPNIPAEAEARFKQSPDYGRYVLGTIQQGPAGNAHRSAPAAPINPPKRGNPFKQFVLLCMRYIELIINDRVNLAILVLQAPIIGLLLLGLTGHGAFNSNKVATCVARVNMLDPTSHPTDNCQVVVDFLKTDQGKMMLQQKNMSANDYLNNDILPGSGTDAQKVLFIMSFAAIMFGCINGSREIVKEAAIYRRERSVNLGIVPYLFSKIAVLGTFSLVQSLILVFMVSIVAPYRNSVLLPPFLEIYVTMALTSLAGLMTGLLISAIVPNNDRAMSIVPLPLIPQVVFAGVIFSLDKPPFLQILGAFFSTRWSMAAMGTTVGLHGDKLDADKFSYVSNLFTTIDGSNHGPAVAHLLLCWVALAVMILIQGAIIAWCLKRKDIRA
ncbi:FHA domain-containing protein [Dictyobacter aurantiacus]|uniref:ABC transporter ATP-binding protein n=1 Tax=Dictyobacter aurantiacus TaxID=1936993 RepID=A0A401ZCJ4_9CHLR|nr:FHA domain-containing protein [Dictyobacter aurantiacus]GCE04597.1 ABC transporter ATP-binding protein [Dictyobacter aurantiacus]